MNVISIFSGIGGFDLALQNLGHTITDAVEIDKYARQIYRKNFPDVTIHNDATQLQVDSLTSHAVLSPEELIIAAGFPCQAFSIAGNRKGFEDTRGTLFFEIARLAKEIKPQILFLENVPGLLSHDKGRTFTTILKCLDEIGYDASWISFNSKYFVPQNRNRVYITANFRRGRRREIFPIGRLDEKTTKKRITSKPDNNIPVVNDRGGLREVERATCLDANYFKGHDYHGARTMIYTLVKAVLTPDRAEKRQNGRRFKEYGEPAFTVNTIDRHGVLINKFRAMTEQRTEESKAIRKKSMQEDGVDWSPRRGKELTIRNDDLANCVTTGQTKESLISDGVKIRKLTPVECERLQGFPDNWTEGISDTQRYKCCGNAVTVPVVQWIASHFEFPKDLAD